jgi:hypothetical protein
MSSTQLVSAIGYDTSRMVFSKPIVGNVKDTSINFRRINISTQYDDGTVGDLIISTERLFSFGVCENVDPTTKKVNGYVFPLCLYGKDGASDDERAFVDTFNKIVDRCKKHLLDSKKELKLHDLEPSDLKKLNPLYYKKIDGEIVDGTGPTLYVKLVVSKKNGQEKILTQFCDIHGNELNALELLKKYCHTRAAVKIESIFLGNKISLQIKLYEAEVELSETGMRKLLPRRSRPQSNSHVQVKTAKSFEDDDDINFDDEPVEDKKDDDESSIKSDDEELAEPEPVKTLPKKKITKVVPKKKIAA